MISFVSPFADIDDPISHDSKTVELMSIDETSVETLISFGFQDEVARKALKASVRSLFNLPSHMSDSGN